MRRFLLTVYRKVRLASSPSGLGYLFPVVFQFNHPLCVLTNREEYRPPAHRPRDQVPLRSLMQRFVSVMAFDCNRILCKEVCYGFPGYDRFYPMEG